LTKTTLLAKIADEQQFESKKGLLTKSQEAFILNGRDGWI
jgi:hypothetical protein